MRKSRSRPLSALHSCTGQQGSSDAAVLRIAGVETPRSCSVVQCVVIGRCVLVMSCCAPEARADALTGVAISGVDTTAAGRRQAGRQTRCKGMQLAYRHPSAARWEAGRTHDRACVRSTAVRLHTMPLLLAGMRACLCRLGTGYPGTSTARINGSQARNRSTSSNAQISGY